MEIYDILTLDDNKDYSLIKIEEINGSTYCLLIEVDEEENPLENIMILKRIQVGENEFEFEEIEDDEEFEKISELFQSKMEEEVNELEDTEE